MTVPVIQGWCPSTLRPMLSGDGWLVRVRPPVGRLTAAQISGLADLADAHGNGFLDLTSRANLQLRGLREAALPTLHTALAGLGLLDPALSAEAEARANILAAPFPDADRDALWHRLHAALVAGDAPALPSKFGFAIDTGGTSRCLADASADIRIERHAGGLMVRADGAETGRGAGSPDEAVALAMALARWFGTSGGVGPDGRGRMRAHLARGALPPRSLTGNFRPLAASATVSAGTGAQGHLVGLAYGQARAGTLRTVAGAARGAVVLTPWRSLLLPPGSDLPALAAEPGLVLDPADPRRRIVACTGAPGCPQALGATRSLAERLAAMLPPEGHLHVAGCPKGCAHPGPARVTLVAQGGGRYGVVRNGTASDPATPLPTAIPPSGPLPAGVSDALRL